MPDVISFARGAPSLDIVDVEGLKAAATRAFDRDPAGTTAYGTAVGYGPLREWIANKHGVDTSQVIVTNGSMQADAFLFDELVEPSDTVIVERPTYDRTLLALRQRLADIRMVELEPDGIDVDGVANLIDAGLEPKLAHIIPNFQNPAGHTLSRDKRDALVNLAREHDFTIFEDDPYVSIRFEGEPIPTMLSQDTAGSPTASNAEFTAPEPSRRNFHTLPLTMGGSAQTKTMMPSTTSVTLPATESTDAAKNPRTRFDASSTTATTSVRSTENQSSGSASTTWKFARPTKSHSPTMFVGPTSLSDIRTSTISG